MKYTGKIIDFPKKIILVYNGLIKSSNFRRFGIIIDQNLIETFRRKKVKWAS